MCSNCKDYEGKVAYCPFCGKRVTKDNTSYNHHHSFEPNNNKFYKDGTRCKRCGQKTIRTINGHTYTYCSFCGYKDVSEGMFRLLRNAIWYATKGQSTSFETKDYLSGKSVSALKLIYENAKSNYEKVCDSNQHLQFNISYVLIALGVMMTLMISSIFKIDSEYSYTVFIPVLLLLASLYLSMTSIFSKTKLCNTACIEDLRKMNTEKEMYNDLINVYEYLAEDVRWYWKCRSTLTTWSVRMLICSIVLYVAILILLSPIADFIISLTLTHELCGMYHL